MWCCVHVPEYRTTSYVSSSMYMSSSLERCACPGIRQCTSDKSHPRRTSQDPRSRKGEALVVARRPPGFRSRRAESPTARPTERPSVSKQASKQAQQRNNLDVAHACFEERMPRSSSSVVSATEPGGAHTSGQQRSRERRAGRGGGFKRQCISIFFCTMAGCTLLPSALAEGKEHA